MDVHASFLGRTTLDLLYVLDQLPAEDTKTFAHAFHAAPGGPACNAALTCARLGGDATLITALGTGPWAHAVRTQLANHRVNLVDIAAGLAYETPITTILVNRSNSTRTIINPPQTPVQLPTVDAWRTEWGSPPRLILTDGFHLRETLPLLRALRQSGATLCLDGGSWKPHTEELAPLLTIAICSERFVPSGAPSQTGSLGTDPEATLNWFAAQGVPHVAVTRGPRSILALDRGRSCEIEIPPIAAIDTTAAGDVLHGAFCLHYEATGDFEHSLRAAATVATNSCRRLGLPASAQMETGTNPKIPGPSFPEHPQNRNREQE